MTTVGKRCPMCKGQNFVEVNDAGLAAWGAGALIQDALPELSPAEREILMTGICDPCYKTLGE